MSLRAASLLFFSVLLAISVTRGLNAQTTTTGGLTGVITDPSDAVVAGAAVEITDNAKGTVQTTKTDRDGVYRFFFLGPSRYTLEVNCEGFREESRMVNVLVANS